MSIEVRDRWVAALRSGEYEQGTGEFEHKGRYCCLGVLCDVMGQPVRTPDEHGITDDNEYFVLTMLDSAMVRRLAALNDGDTHPEGTGAPAPFTEIADHIEREVQVS
jgi:hypothetical protein